MLTPKDAAGIALAVAIAGAHAANGRISHRIAYNMGESLRTRAERARSDLTALGLWSDARDLPAAVARSSNGRVKPNGLADRMLEMGLLAAAVYIRACEADTLGLILAHEGVPHLAKQLSALEPRLESARESLGFAIARFMEAIDDSVSPAVRDAAIELARKSAANVPAWNGPDAKHLGRPGEAWTAGVFEGMRRVYVALGFPPERTPAPASDAEVAGVQAILAQPDDDALRQEWIALASARGEVRAELARAQMQTRAKRREHPDWMTFDDELVGSLITRHPEWQRDAKRLGATAAGLHRGFVEDIEIDAEVFLASGRELFAIAPILHVRLRGGAAPFLEPLIGSGLLERMLAIDLSHQDLDDTHAGLLASRGPSNLRALSLAGNRITDAGARALYASDRLRQLRFLSLAENPCGPLAETGFTHQECPTEVVELTELGRRLETELGTRRYAYELTVPSFDILTVVR